MIIGYARVSTTDQKLDCQLDNLKERGCERIYNEKMTGTNSNRPEYQKMLASLRPGDTLVVYSFSRLSRSTKELLEVTDWMQNNQITFVSLHEQIDTSTATGKLMMTVLSALSQFERDLIAERTRDGLKAARARGRNGGRKPAGDAATKQRALAMYEANAMTNAEIAEMVGVSRATLSRWIREKKDAANTNAKA